MTYKELFYFTGRCLSLDEHPEFREEVIKQLLASQQNLESFIQLCSDHLIIPVIYLKFKAYKILKHLPEEYVQALKEIYDLNCQRNEQILRQIDEIAAELNKENIQPVFLKGTANLLDGLYSDVGERMIGDIDFLVKEEDFFKAAEVLMRTGYLSQPRIAGPDISPPHHHFPSLSKNEFPANVEIHRVPVVIKYSQKFTNISVFSQKKEIRGNENAFVSSDNHKAIHAFIHCQLSNSGHNRWNVAIRDIYDTYLISKRINLSEVFDTVEEKFKAQVFCCLVSQMFNIELNSRFLNNFKVKRYVKKYNWWMDHPKLHVLYFKIIDLANLIFVNDFGNIIQATYSKSHRAFIWIRLKNPQWYRSHLILIKSKFM